MAEEVLEEAVAPRGRRAGPGHLEAAGDGVGTLAGAEAALPAQALSLDRARLGLGADQVGVAGAVGLAERVTTGDQGERLLVVHRHPAEGLADVARSGQRVRVAVGALRVHVDQAHLHGAERTGQLAVAAVALVAEPGVLRAPEDLLGLPDVLAAEPEAEGLEAHRLQRAVPGEAPAGRPTRSCVPYFCLTGQSSRRALSRFALSGQLLSGAKRWAPSPAPPRPSSMRYVPAACQLIRMNSAAVVAEVGRPPVLRRRHHLDDVLLQRLDVQRLERPRRSRSRRPAGWPAVSSGAAPTGRAGWATSRCSSVADSSRESGSR